VKPSQDIRTAGAGNANAMAELCSNCVDLDRSRHAADPVRGFEKVAGIAGGDPAIRPELLP
jgi:hypothetical protein